jgi:hypothetical protein
MLILALMLYPLWGFPLLIFLCISLAITGSLKRRIFVAVAVGILSNALFTPVMYGGEGIGFMVPWIFALTDNQHSFFSWELAAFVFAVAFGTNFLSSSKA